MSEGVRVRERRPSDGAGSGRSGAMEIAGKDRSDEVADSGFGVWGLRFGGSEGQMAQIEFIRIRSGSIQEVD